MATKVLLLFLLLSFGKTLAFNESDDAVSKIKYASIMQVCHITEVTLTSNNNIPPRCDALPMIYSSDDFFDQAYYSSDYIMDCDDNTKDEPLARKPTIWDRSVKALHWLLEGASNKIKDLVFILKDAISDISAASLITKRWEAFWYVIASTSATLMFFVQGFAISRPGKLVYNVMLNALTGFGLTAALYMCHLYFMNLYVMALVTVITLFAFSPFFPQTMFTAIGFFTLLELCLPLLGMLAYIYFKTALYFGPFASLAINLGSIFVTCLCFIALYIDEKLIVVKVFLLPFYMMCARVFNFSGSSGKQVEFMNEEAEDLTRSVFKTFGDRVPADLSSIQQLDRAITRALWWNCYERVSQFTGRCHMHVTDLCLKGALEISTFAWYSAWFFCDGKAASACAKMKVKTMDDYSFCHVPGNSAFGQMYDDYLKSLKDLYRAIVIDPVAPKVNKDVLEVTTGFDLMAASWTWWIARTLRWGLAAVCLAVVLLAFVSAGNFLYKYWGDLYFCNNYLSTYKMEEWRIVLTRREKRKYYSSFSQAMRDFIFIVIKHPMRFKKCMEPILYTLVCYSVEKMAQRFHRALQSIEFMVPELADARFTFNVQGSSMIAYLLRLIMGSFNIHSRYCKIADSSVCSSAFVPVHWLEWLKLFSVALFYFALGIFQSKSDYIMCRLADFMIPYQGEKRAEVVLEDCIVERQRKMIITNAMAREEIDDPVFDCSKNDLIIAFYAPRKCFHRWVPTVGLSVIAYFFYGIDNILCQVCGQSLIERRFRCKRLLMCEECAMFMRRCPCNSQLCLDSMTFAV